MTPYDAVRELTDAHARQVFLAHEWVTVGPTGTGTYTLSGLGLTGEPLAGESLTDAQAAADTHILATLSTVRVTRWIAYGDEQRRALFVIPTP